MTVTVPDSLLYGGTLSAADYAAAAAGYWIRTEGATPAEPELTATCDKVYLEGRFSPTASATGIAVDMPIMEIFELEDGLVVSDTLFFFDSAQIVEALGTEGA